MNTEKQSKVNQLLSFQPPGTIMQSFWLKEQGYSFELQKRHKKSRWLESFGTGALKRVNDSHPTDHPVSLRTDHPISAATDQAFHYELC
jgi:hypothetical protein